jgi:hypothetical protein
MAIDFAAREVGLKIQYACGDYRDNPYAKWMSPKLVAAKT